MYSYLIYQETSELLRQSTEDKNIKLINKIPENTYIEADKDMISLIIRNLISNAIKFTHKGGKILIDAKNKLIEITVKDNGIGIPKEIQSKLFDIDENKSTQGTENETGTGLGLILCKEFVEKHGGEIWVESEVDKGSKFIFTLPTTM
jgi:signal transduction histidine kinase